MSIPYRFSPWARRGLARSHQNNDAANAALQVRAKVAIGLTLQAKQDGNAVTADGKPVAAVSGNLELALYGPGDIIGIDSRLVVRTDPKPNVTNFEPNYLAIVDFDPPDFPWLLTPAKANPDQHLRPWLVLVVIDRAVARALPSVKAGQPLPSIVLTAAQAASELPDLNESWLWAHAQAVSTISNDPAALASELKQYPERNISRLVCPRRLEPRHDYIACVVPAFDAGRLRGLGQPLHNATLAPAWNHAQPVDIELPVYYHWEFSTGPVGDIETLARRLRTPASYAGDQALLSQLKNIGIRPVAVDGDHLLFDGVTPDQTVFEGAMVPLDFQPESVGNHPLFAQHIEAMLNSGQELANQGTAKADTVPTLSPPIYGEYPAKRHTVDQSKIGQNWLDDLNLQPRYRLAAGWGAEVIRQNQDEFMQAAWAQAGDVLAAERAFSLSRLSRDVLKAVEARHLTKLPDARLLALLSPARARARIAPDLSLYGRMANVTLPDELFDGAMRRFTSARRPTFRMAQWRERNLGLASLPQQMVALVNTFANATKQVMAIDPNRFVPDGIMGSRSFDGIPLPADLNTLVDLQPYTGLPGSIAAGDIAKLQQMAASARQQAARAKRKLPLMGDIWHQGIVTDTHLLRIAQLQRVSGQALRGNLTQLVKQASRGGAEGVLLTVEASGQVSAQALKIDGRNGALKTIGNALVLGTRGATRAVRMAPGAVAAVSPHALRLYGNDAVFNSLAPGVLGGATPVQLNLTAPGQFAPQGPPPQVAPSITLPPAIKSRDVLHRYSQAFKDYEQLWVDPLKEEHIVVQPVDFAIAASSTALRVRIDPAQTVPARLATMLTLGGQPVRWSATQGLANDFISTRLDLSFAERLRYLIPLHFDRVMAYPHLPFPLSKKLEKLAPDVFLPGVGVLPDDFIMAVKTNARFVEAVMLGGNHEMGRELLWQGFPTDQRGTPFQHFWQRLDDKTDIDPIHFWQAQPLGKQPGSGEMLVLLIRGQLLARFPTLSVYAYPIDAQETRPGGSSPPVPPGAKDPKEMDPTRALVPILKGHLGRDITYLGFNISPTRDPNIPNQKDDHKYMENFYFVLEEQMTEPRFGFDEPDHAGPGDAGWQNVDWSEVLVNGGEYFGSAKLKLAPPAQGKPNWVNPHAATVADALLQRPFRGYYAGVKLKMPK
ncbi:MAG: hypothetical protein WBX11_04535 [Thiobacillaceae bacterium]